MGGWCLARERCDYYVLPPLVGGATRPIDRLCPPGHDTPNDRRRRLHVSVAGNSKAIQMANWCWEHPEDTLNTNDFCTKFNLSSPSARALLSELCHLGLLERITQGNGGGHPSLYRCPTRGEPLAAQPEGETKCASHSPTPSDCYKAAHSPMNAPTGCMPS